MCLAMEFDFGALGSMLGGVGGLVAGAAAVFLAYYAYQGLSAWKDQLRTGRTLDAGESLLKHIYEADDVLKYITGPFITAAELRRIERKPEETDSDYRLRQSYDAVWNRYKEHEEVFNRLRASCFHAKAVLGEAIFDAGTKIQLFPNHIFDAARSLMACQKELERIERRARTTGITPLELDAANDKCQAASDYFYGLGDGADLSKKRESLVSEAEELIRTAMKDAFDKPSNGSPARFVDSQSISPVRENQG